MRESERYLVSFNSNIRFGAAKGCTLYRRTSIPAAHKTAVFKARGRYSFIPPNRRTGGTEQSTGGTQHYDLRSKLIQDESKILRCDESCAYFSQCVFLIVLVIGSHLEAGARYNVEGLWANSRKL